MPLPAIIAVSLAVLGSSIYVANGIRGFFRRRRNLARWERGEPLEGGVDDWD
ncbi:MAG TPA: hypothetical protein VHK47_13990 [Polyangia bacterium]|jgi:hypothetical protein|nr:hypothetical protein [Polyangia bacterium]